MHTEFEVTFPNIDKDALRRQILELWGICTRSRTLMRRAVFSHPTDQNAYLRVRDEGARVTTTYKYFSPGELTIHSVQEIECEVSDFAGMREIYLAMWLRQKSYQETYREVWSINQEIECMIDEWPGLHPFVEIEWSDERVVREYVEKLGFDYTAWIFGAVDQIYFRELGIPCDIFNTKTPIVTFDNPPERYA